MEKSAEITILPPQPTDIILEIASDDKMLVTVRWNGDLEFGPDYTPDEAARIFWESIAANIPHHLLV